MKIETWPLSPGLEGEMLDHYKAKEAPSFAGRGAPAIVGEFTFDDVAPELTMEDCEALLCWSEQLLPKPLSGVGLEAGGGPGTWSALIARSLKVEKMYALDACSPIVALAPEVVRALLPGQEQKVIPVVGDFDNLQLADSSIDFVFDFFSLHHSVDQQRTFTEFFRVLKPGGIVLCFDKARADALTDNDLKALLDKEYPEDFKRKMGVPPGVPHTRRMNGEREYRLREWREAFVSAGFSRFEHYNVARVTSHNALVAAGKRLFAKLPPRLQSLYTWLVIPASKPGVTISADHRVYSPLVQKFPKEISLMIATK
jgi:ubiquinone/menaquinone biosynthesis C-methylase UbiE